MTFFVDLLNNKFWGFSFTCTKLLLISNLVRMYFFMVVTIFKTRQKIEIAALRYGCTESDTPKPIKDNTLYESANCIQKKDFFVVNTTFA